MSKGESMKGRLNALFLIGLIGTVVFGFHFGLQYGRALWGDRDIWWTPMAMAIPLQETRQTFNLFVSGELLQNHIERGSLSATDSKGRSYPVAADDIKVRINNWYKIKASFLHFAVFAGILLGGSIACLIMGTIELFKKRKNPNLPQPEI